MFTVTITYYMQDKVRYHCDAAGLAPALALINLAHVASVLIESDKD